MGQAIEMVPYDLGWPAQFLALCSFVAPALGSAVLTIEHVGSTAVPGLPAKPIIDMVRPANNCLWQLFRE
jgi:GrpB-like predicted nucleotidyltransferase (UPF0157 family)